MAAKHTDATTDGPEWVPAEIRDAVAYLSRSAKDYPEGSDARLVIEDSLARYQAVVAEAA